MILAAALALPAAAQVVTPAPPSGAPPSGSTPFEMPRADDAPPGGLPGADPFRFPDQIRPDSGEPLSPLDELMNNMLRRAQPHLEGLARDMGGLMNEYAPVFEEFGTLIDDIGNYELPPERLANGDIIIRRKADAPPPPPLEQLPNFLPGGEGSGAPRIPEPRIPDSQPLPDGVGNGGQIDL